MGENFSGQATRVVVLIELANGRQIGWELFEPSVARWDMTAIGNQGTRAKLTAEGVFHRMSRGAIEPTFRHDEFWERGERPRELEEG